MSAATLDGSEIVDAPEPKRRGRPPNFPVDAAEPSSEVDLPESVPLDTERPKKRRGRPPKSERNLDGVKQLLFTTHMVLSRIASCPELAIDDAEASMFATSLATLADHYKIRLEGKSGAVVGFIYTLGIIYGPRAIAISIRLRNERKKPNDEPDQTA